MCWLGKSGVRRDNAVGYSSFFRGCLRVSKLRFGGMVCSVLMQFFLHNPEPEVSCLAGISQSAPVFSPSGNQSCPPYKAGLFFFFSFSSRYLTSFYLHFSCLSKQSAEIKIQNCNINHDRSDFPREPFASARRSHLPYV